MSNAWKTPQALFDGLDMEFGFSIDLCATRENTKCPLYFDEHINALKQPWTGICFMNPPYGKGLGSWVKKAYQENRTRGTIIVALLPAKCGTSWFHDYIYGKAEIRFIRGRLKFSDRPGRCPFDSMIVIWR